MQFKFDLEDFYNKIKRLDAFRFMNEAVFLPGVIAFMYDRDIPNHRHASQHHFIFTDKTKDIYNMKFIIDVKHAKAQISVFSKCIEDVRKKRKFKPKDAVIETSLWDNDDGFFIKVEGTLPDGYYQKTIISKIRKYNKEDSAIINLLNIMNKTDSLLLEGGFVKVVKFSDEDVLRLMNETPYMQLYEIDMPIEKVKVTLTKSYFYGIRGKTPPQDMKLMLRETIDPNVYLVTIEYQNKDIKEGHIHLIGTW